LGKKGLNDMYKMAKKIMGILIPSLLKKKLAPVRMHLRLYKTYHKDLLRFYRYSGFCSRTRKQQNLRSMIAINYHRIEKGLSLKNCRKGFGLWFLGDLQKDLLQYVSLYGPDDVWNAAVSTLGAYYTHSDGFVFEPEVLQDYDALCDRQQSAGCSCTMIGGVKEVSVTDLDAGRAGGYEPFLRTRHSIRQFSSEPVTQEQIHRIVELAQLAPSACNRQPSRVYVAYNRDLINELLTIQGGAKGFAEQVDKLLFVTVDLHEYHIIGERNEAWVDGGIYLGHLLQAIHCVGLGGCCLNWCVDSGRDERVRHLIGVADGEIIIALVAVGNLPASLPVAASPRLQVSSVLKEIM
jgi:nitroreductase